jgi:hypothetical protein
MPPSKSACRIEAVSTDEDGGDRLSTRLLRWGVVGPAVLQSEDAGVYEPVDGRWYA